jgi:hypothetical protein
MPRPAQPVSPKTWSIPAGAAGGRTRCWPADMKPIGKRPNPRRAAGDRCGRVSVVIRQVATLSALQRLKGTHAPPRVAPGSGHPFASIPRRGYERCWQRQAFQNPAVTRRSNPRSTRMAAMTGRRGPLAAAGPHQMRQARTGSPSGCTTFGFIASPQAGGHIQNRDV